MTRRDYYLAQTEKCQSIVGMDGGGALDAGYASAAVAWQRLADGEGASANAGGDDGVSGPSLLARHSPVPDRDAEPKVFAAHGDNETAGSVAAAILAASPDCVKLLDLDGHLIFMSEGGKRTMEVADFELIRGLYWPHFWEGAARQTAVEALAVARCGGTARFQGHAPTMAGRQRAWDVTVSPMPGVGTTVEHLLSVSRDVTETDAARDLSHLSEAVERMNNILGVVQALALQSLRGSDTLEVARFKLSNRIVAVANAYRMTMQNDDRTAEMMSLALASVGLQDPQLAMRVRLDGPEVHLGSEAALCFALVVHELMVNAVSHGALSTPDGSVEITWAQRTERGHRQLDFVCQEVGGQPIAPPIHKGFGTHYMERGARHALGASFDFDYPSTGARIAMIFTIRAESSRAMN